MTGQSSDENGESPCLTSDELECKICYNRYNLRQRTPKVLECCHRVCAKCLYKIIDYGDSPQSVIICPFCRFETCLPDNEVSSLPDDNNIIAALASIGKGRKNFLENPTELLLTPKRLATLETPSHNSSNCLVITIMEVQRERVQSPSLAAPIVEFYRPSSFDSITPVSQQWTVWNCTALLCQTWARAVVWFLGLLYFSSLPLGIYLLVSKKITLGVIFISLVPSSLLILMVYGFCQCICHEFMECMSP
ncbi:E3 ubiquitin-protein ligase RNF182 [Protopterus annectens]|uniref:E3 ubiquitin-protein ligase RNF182 n=1 Tax=Protopterus annectens TaxID=7888 RepID=UPI001CF96475|nr:E3 ubiquitin-protein ligase RNF182 [Protopterus annectens]